MTRDEFCKYHWDYYMILEKDFLEIERYLTFDLGDNNFYTVPDNSTDPANSKAFSVEFVKQYQTICSEIDVILKSMCKELGNTNANNMKQYAETILTSADWGNIVNQKVLMRKVELQPFVGWATNQYHPIVWWPKYNDVKHERLDNLREANLKNVANALAGLFILGHYFVKKIADDTGNLDVIDVPNDKSALFQMLNWQTIWTVQGKDEYPIPTHQLTRLFQGNN
ncbi:MAG: hypothetical protein ACI39W_09440 [Brotaphodocola sp.]